MYIDSDIVRVKHMLDACREAISFVKDESRESLDTDRKLMLSLIHLLEISGEAANSLSDDFREKNSQVPWHQVIGMRNRLIHGYFDINLDVVWKTVIEDLPILVQYLEKLV